MKKVLLLLLISFIFCGIAFAEEQKPLYLWVPYDSKKPGDINNLDNKYIFIQDSDLEEIKKSKNPRKSDSGKPPVGYQITSADYYAEITNENVKIKGIYKINNLDDKWKTIPVLSSQIPVKSAFLGEKPALLTSGKGYHTLVMKTKGNYTLTLNFSKKIDNIASQNTRSFNFSRPLIPITTLECAINEKDILFDVPNSVSVEPINMPEGTKAIISMLPAGNIQVKWTPKSSLISDIKQDNNFSPSATAVTYSKIETGRGALKGTFNAEIDIRRSPLSHFEFYIPHGIEIDSINVQNGEFTDSYPEIKDNILAVDLVSPVEGKVKIELAFRRNFNDSSFKTKIPAITLVNENIDRETGFVALVETTNIESSIVEADPAKNYREIDSRELTGVLRGLKPSIALKYTKNKENIKEIPYDITINIVRHKDVAVYEANIEYTDITSVLSKDGGMFTKAVIWVKNTSKQFLDITLPKNSSIWSVYVNNKSVKPALKDAEKGIYAIPLAKSSSFPIEAVYFTDNAAAGYLANLKAVKTELMSNSVKWNIYAPDNRDFIFIEAFSNLLKDKKSYKITRRRSFGLMRGRMDSATGDIKPEMSREVQSLEKAMPSPLMPDFQQVYKSKKIGKMPVYVNLPLIGKNQGFYQLSFESDKFPSVFALYLNSFILKLLIILVITAAVYALFKIRKKWLPKVVGLFKAVKSKIPKKFLIIGAAVLLLIAGFIFIPQLTVMLVLLSIAVLAAAGVIFLIRFLLRKWRGKDNENQ